jgi:phosphoribosyl-ATP pyrophosphohydrolase/phosphoribosyl-AMP cyclohydrolase
VLHGPVRRGCTLLSTMSTLPLKFDSLGLVPVIVQDQLTGEIRMFAYATDAAVRKTIETGSATFWSRSRGELWQKGRASGYETPVVRVLADCDADCVIYSSEPQGPSCHSGAPSCFFQALDGEHLEQASEQPQTLLASLEAAIASQSPHRKASGGSQPPRPPGAQPSEAAAKIVEEAGALARALDAEGDDRVVSEAAETLYQLMVGLRARAITFRRVLVELAQRRGPGASDHANPRHEHT